MPRTQLSRAHRHHLWRGLVFATTLACISVTAPATAAPATAPAVAAAALVPPVGGVEIDGNTTSDGGPDWDTVGTHIPDPGGNADTSAYGSAKDDTNPSTWVSGPVGSPSLDFLDAWTYTSIIGDDVYTDFAFKRMSNNGTVNFDAEFNQLDNLPGAPAKPDRSVGDLLVDVQQQGSGDFTVQHAYLWKLQSDWAAASCGNDSLAVPGYSPAAGWCEIDVPGGAFTGATDTNVFAEGALNLSALFGSGNCSNAFGALNLRSRSSDSQTSDLHDYIAVDVDVPSTCGSLTIEKRNPDNELVPGATFKIEGDPTPGSNAAELIVTDGGAGDSDNTANGIIVISPAEPGTYTVTETGAPNGYLFPADRDQVVTVDPKGGENDDVTITFVDPYKWEAPTVTKNAVATYAASYDWSIDKKVDKAEWNVPEGTKASPTYTVTVTAGDEQTSNYKVTGSLSITNPNTRPMVVTVTDVLSDGTACTVAGTDADPNAAGEQRTLKKNADGLTTLTYECTYAQAPASLKGTNTATLTWSRATYPQTQGQAEDPANAGTGTAQGISDEYTFTRTSRTDETVTVKDSLKGNLGTLNWDDVYNENPEHQHVYSYSLDFTPTAGTCETYDNTATVTETDTDTAHDDSASVKVCVGRDLTVTKTVAVAYERAYDWALDKTGPAHVFVGDDGKTTVDYQIEVTAKPTIDSDPILTGKITVANPNDWDVTADVTDVFTLNGDDVTCDVTGGDDAVVPADDTLVLDYECVINAGQWPDNYQGTNNVKVTWDKALYFSPTGEATYQNKVEDSETTETPANKTINLVDAITKAGGNPANVTLTPSTLNWVDVYGAADSDHTTTINASVDLDTGLAAGACTTYDNVVSITGTQISDNATTEVCRPEIDKSVTAQFGRTYSWEIAKTVDKDSVEIGPNGTAKFHYSVTVTPKDFTDDTAAWNGTISVTNPSSTTALNTTITDVSGVAGWTCTITGDPAIAVDPGKTVDVDYTCTGDTTTHPDGTNTATATFGGKTVTKQVPVTFAKASDVNKVVTVTDPNAPEPPFTDGVLGTADWSAGAKTFEYDWTAPAGNLGVCTPYDNTATIKETGDKDTVQVKVCREAPLEVTKTADGTFDRTYHWKIAKTAADTEPVVIPDGDDYDFDYTVDVTKDGFTDSNWKASGKITVHNPNEYADGSIVADVTDKLAGVTGGVCTVVNGTDVELAPGATKVLDYACTFADKPDAYTGTNTATASWTDPDAKPATATGDKELTLQIDKEINKSVDVVDDKTVPGETHPLGTSTWDNGPFQYTYTVTKTGVPGTCTSYKNIAEITQTEQSANATVQLCVTKTPSAAAGATASFDRTYDWSITKEADQTTAQAGVNGKATINYVVSAVPGTSTDSGWTTSGSVKVTNPNDFKDLSAAISVTLDVGAPATCAATGSPVNVPAGQSVDVPITCTLASSGYVDGSATVSIAWGPGSPVVTQTPVAFVLDTETNRTVTVTDDKAGTVGAPATLGSAEWNDQGEPIEFTYALELPGIAGQCQTYTNTATIVETEQTAGQQVKVCMPGQIAGVNLALNATIKTACVTKRYGEALVTGISAASSNIPGTVFVRVGKKLKSTITLQPGETRDVHLSALKIRKVVTVTNEAGRVLAQAKVKGGCKFKSIAPTTGFRQASWGGGTLAVPAAGVSAPMVSTRSQRVPMNSAALGRAFFWQRDGQPGGPGSVLVALHSNRSGWAAGNRLPKLRKGATVQVHLASGKVLTYRVTKTVARAPLNLSEKKLAELQSNFGPSKLVLTTCNRWALAGGKYKYRSLAYAELID